MEKKVNKRKRKILNSSETSKIIDVWRAHIKEIRSNIKNSHIFKEMCAELKEVHNIDLTCEELRTRINNLTKKFRSEKREKGVSGGSLSDWEFFEAINEFIGNFKSNCPTEVLSESIDEEILLADKFPMSPEATSSPMLSPASTSAETISFPGPSRSAETPSPVPSASSSSAKKKKFNEIYLELYKKDQKTFEKFCEKNIENDDKMLKLMEENNAILSLLLQKENNK